MKFLLRIIISYLFLFSFIYPLNHNFIKSEVQLNFKDDLVKDIAISNDKKKALLAAGLSAILPGSGQFYLGKKIAGSIYMAIEASLWLTRDHYLDKATLSSEVYKQYVRDHWSISKWIRDYYNPTMLEVTTTGNIDDSNGSYTYTNAFVVNPDDVYNEFIIGDSEDEFDEYYHLAWDQGHSAEFDYEGTIISTSDETNFKEIYKDICNTNAELDYICVLELIGPYTNESEIPEYGTELYYDMLLEQIDNRINSVIYSHHLYEGVGKYNMFFSGWDDSALGEVIVGSGGYPILDSPHKLFYEHTLRLEHKDNNDKAGNLLSLLLVNRAISMFNILLNDSRVSISSNVSHTKYATNKIKLSIGF